MWKYKPTHPASALRLCSLPLRPGWSFQPETAETVTNRQKLTTKKHTHTEDSAHLGSSWLELPLPYSGITFSLLMPALHTGHCCRLGRVSNHWWGGAEQGEGCQNDCNTRHTNRSLFADSRVEPKWRYPLHFLKLYLQQEMWSTTCLQWWAVKEVAVRGGIKYISIFKLH